MLRRDVTAGICDYPVAWGLCFDGLLKRVCVFFFFFFFFFFGPEGVIFSRPGT